MKQAAICLILAVCSSPAIAEENADSYFEFSYAQLTYSETGIDDFKPSALVMTLGQSLNDNLAIEARLGLGVQEGSNGYYGYNFTYDLDRLFGFYLAAHVPVGNNVTLRTTAGFTSIEATYGVTGYGSASETDDGFSYGIGGQIDVSPSASIAIDYTNYLNEDLFDLTAVSLSFRSNW